MKQRRKRRLKYIQCSDLRMVKAQARSILENHFGAEILKICKYLRSMSRYDILSGGFLGKSQLGWYRESLLLVPLLGWGVFCFRK